MHPQRLSGKVFGTAADWGGWSLEGRRLGAQPWWLSASACSIVLRTPRSQEQRSLYLSTYVCKGHAVAAYPQMASAEAMQRRVTGQQEIIQPMTGADRSLWR